jgi:hypothetical protein
MSQVLKQKFSVQIHQLFRTAGFTMSITQTEQLQLVSDKIIDLVEDIAKERAVELVRKMQEAVGAGFTKIGQDIDAIEARLDKKDSLTADGGKIRPFVVGE